LLLLLGHAEAVKSGGKQERREVEGWRKKGRGDGGMFKGGRVEKKSKEGDRKSSHQAIDAK
jgi:hypothetical protein